MRGFTALAAALLFSGIAHAGDAPKLSATERAAIDLAARRGALLYSYDQAAWHGTDDMLAKIDRTTFTSAGWIVDGPADAPELVFFDNDTTDPHAVYSAAFRDGKLIAARLLHGGEDAALSPLRKRMIAALGTARIAFTAQKVALCSKDRPNTVVLPPETPDGPILVYLLTPQPDLNTVPFGGNYRVEIAADGTAGPVHAFSKSCLMSPIGDRQHKTAMLVVTHLLDPTPTEIHVFQSFVAHVPVAVATIANRYLWTVDRTHIVPVSVLAKK